MKKILTLLAAVALLASCGEDAAVRRAVTKEIKSRLADPGSFKFVSMERVEAFTVETEAARASALIPDLGRGQWIQGENGGRFTHEITERRRAELRETAATMRADSVVGGVYRFDYRADIPGEGRDFPVEVYVVASTDGYIGGMGRSAGDAIYRSPTIVKEFQDFTRRDQ